MDNDKLIKFDSFMENITADIATKVVETRDRFIFTTINSWLNEKYDITVSKRMLIRALQCFQEEHFDEYEHLKKLMRDKESEDE